MEPHLLAYSPLWLPTLSLAFVQVLVIASGFPSLLHLLQPGCKFLHPKNMAALDLAATAAPPNGHLLQPHHKSSHPKGKAALDLAAIAAFLGDPS